MDDASVAPVMSTELRTVAPGTPLPEAATRMLDGEIGSVFVVEGDRLAGIVTTTDFVGVVADGSRAEATAATVVGVVTTTGPAAYLSRVGPPSPP